MKLPLPWHLPSFLYDPISQHGIMQGLQEIALTDWVQIPTLPLTSCISKLIALSGPPYPTENQYLPHRVFSEDANMKQAHSLESLLVGVS